MLPCHRSKHQLLMQRYCDIRHDPIQAGLMKHWLRFDSWHPLGISPTSHGFPRSPLPTPTLVLPLMCPLDSAGGGSAAVRGSAGSLVTLKGAAGAGKPLEMWVPQWLPGGETGWARGVSGHLCARRLWACSSERSSPPLLSLQPRRDPQHHLLLPGGGP